MESKLYIPFHFKEDDRARINEILTQYPFATLILTQNNIPHVVHLPVLFDVEMHCLRGHIAKSNEISRLDLNIPYNCLVIFQGPDAYISPSWYHTKGETGKVVPTWNYITVHVEGRLALISDKEWIQHNVSLLSEKHEGIVGSSWRVADAPSSYIDNLSRAIVGVEISITSMDAKFKLSQNKNEADVTGVMEGLRKTGKEGDRRMADWIEKLHLSDK